METNLKFLVVEDNEKHAADAKRVAEKMGLNIVTARTEREAENLMYKIEWRKGEGECHIQLVDAVVTDIFLPLIGAEAAGGRTLWDNDQSPCGLLVAMKAQKAKIPFALCTSGYHHGAKYQWIQYMTRLLGWPDMVDCHTAGYEGEADTKNWKSAFEQAIKEVQKREAVEPQ